MTIQDLFKEVERSPVADKWRLIDRVLRLPATVAPGRTRAKNMKYLLGAGGFLLLWAIGLA
jgi:hypothetical protein